MLASLISENLINLFFFSVISYQSDEFWHLAAIALIMGFLPFAIVTKMASPKRALTRLIAATLCAVISVFVTFSLGVALFFLLVWLLFFYRRYREIVTEYRIGDLYKGFMITDTIITIVYMAYAWISGTVMPTFPLLFAAILLRIVTVRYSDPSRTQTGAQVRSSRIRQPMFILAGICVATFIAIATFQKQLLSALYQGLVVILSGIFFVLAPLIQLLAIILHFPQPSHHHKVFLGGNPAVVQGIGITQLTAISRALFITILIVCLVLLLIHAKNKQQTPVVEDAADAVLVERQTNKKTRRRRTDRAVTPIRRLFVKWRRELEQHGIVEQSSALTARELLQHAAQNLPGRIEESAELVTLYESERYRGVTIDEQRVAALAGRLKGKHHPPS